MVGGLHGRNAVATDLFIGGVHPLVGHPEAGGCRDAQARQVVTDVGWSRASTCTYEVRVRGRRASVSAAMAVSSSSAAVNRPVGTGRDRADRANIRNQYEQMFDFGGISGYR